eukprot:scaffold4044_cov399-Prasinococcus_capsulatus_cf.AAC.7
MGDLEWGYATMDDEGAQGARNIWLAHRARDLLSLRNGRRDRRPRRVAERLPPAQPPPRGPIACCPSLRS